MKKRIDCFLTRGDEVLFSNEIKEKIHNISFIDGFDEAKIPSEKPSLEMCENDFIRIWNKDLFPNIETNKTSFVYFQRTNSLDPTSKVERNNFLSSGSLSIEIHDNHPKKKEMAEFVKTLWKTLKEITSNKLYTIDIEKGHIIDKARNVVAGKHAIEWCNSNTKNFFKFRSVQVYLKPF